MGRVGCRINVVMAVHFEKYVLYRRVVSYCIVSEISLKLNEDLILKIKINSIAIMAKNTFKNLMK